MPMRTLVALLAGLLLLVAACDDNGAEPDNGEDVGGELDGEAPDDELGGEAPEPVDLAEGVAGTVDGEEISDEEVEESAAGLARLPQFQAQIEQGQLPEELLPTIALEQAIHTLVLERGAAELGVEVEQADLDAAEEDLVDELGGREEFEAQLEQAGYDDDILEEHLRLEVIVSGVQEQLGVDDAAEDEEAQVGPDGQPVDPGQRAVQEWLFERLTESDIAADERYGVWVDAEAALMPPEELLPEQPPMGDMEGLEDIDPEELEDMDPEELEEFLQEQMGG